MAIAFLSFVSGGMLASLACCRLEQVAWKFLRMVAIVAFLLAGGVGMWVWRQPHAVPIGGGWGGAMSWTAAGIAFLVMVIAPLAKRHAAAARIACGVGGLAGVVAGCLWSLGPDGAPIGGWTVRGAAVLGGQVGGAMILGSVTVAWMLGHAYLTATAMTIAPLRRMSRVLAAAVVARLAYVAVCLVALWWATGPAGMWAESWPALCLRVGAGLVLLTMFAYMVMDCVRLRSTQSATGILYFASLLAYVGELSSQHLVAKWGWPM